MNSTKRNFRFRNAALAFAALLALPGLAGTASAQTSHQTADNFTEIYGSWTVNCNRAGNAADGDLQCQMVQDITNTQTQQRYLRTTLNLQDEDGPLLVVIAPFGLDLSRGVELRVDETDWGNRQFRTCGPEGCYARVDLVEEQIGELRGGNQLVVRLSDVNGNQLDLGVQLSGFTRAFQRLESTRASQDQNDSG